MAHILNDGEHEKDIQPHRNIESYKKDVALAMFLRMRDNRSNLRLGYTVMAAGKFDDIVLIDDAEQVMHFIQIKYCCPENSTVKPIAKRKLILEEDFEPFIYLQSYMKVNSTFKDSSYRKKFYILSNEETAITYKVFREGKEPYMNETLFQMFCGSTNWYTKLTPTRKLIHIFTHQTNNTDIKEAIISNEPRKRFRSSKGDQDQNDVHLRRKVLKFQHSPLQVKEEEVRRFFSDLSFLVGKSNDLRKMIDSEFHKLLRAWIPPVMLEKMTKNDKERVYYKLEKLFEEGYQLKGNKATLLLKTVDVQQFVEELRNVNKTLMAENKDELNDFYINRRIVCTKRTKLTVAKASQNYRILTDDIQLVKELQSRYKDQRCFVLIADPGMGKTTLLKYLAFEVQKRYNCNVFYVHLSGLIKSFDKVEGVSTFNEMINVLQAALSKESCDTIRHAPDKRNYDGCSIFLVLDGFDEIYSKYTKKVIDMLKLLETKQSIQFVISSRMHAQNLLETELDAQSMFLEPFSEEDQINYLRKKWNDSNDAESFFKLYTENVLTQIDSSKVSELRDIFGLPLIMATLADMHYNNFEQYKKYIIAKQKQKFRFSTDKFSLPALYELFTRKCFYRQLTARTGGCFDEVDMDLMVEGYVLEHQLLALKLLDVELGESFFENLFYKKIYEMFLYRCEVEAEESVLVKVIEKRVQFCLPFCREYFAAKYLCDNIHALQGVRIMRVFNEHDTIRRLSMMMLDGSGENLDVLNDLCKIDSSISFRACEMGSLNISRFLFNGNISFSNSDLNRMLRISVKNGHVEICQLLLKHMVHPNEPDQKGWTALHMAAESGNIQIIELLIAAKAIPNPRTYDKSTPLHIAAIKGHEEAAKLLLRFNNDVNAINSEKCTALHLAARIGNVALVDLLLKHHADVNALDCNDRTPLHMAAEIGNFQVIRALIIAEAKRL